jgi:hypothetical protein
VDEDDNIDLFGSDSEVCLKCEWVEFIFLLFFLSGFMALLV